jgi:hypothetical protein
MRDDPLIFVTDPFQCIPEGENIRIVDYSGDHRFERVMSRHNFLLTGANVRKCIASWTKAEFPLGHGDEG